MGNNIIDIYIKFTNIQKRIYAKNRKDIINSEKGILKYKN